MRNTAIIWKRMCSVLMRGEICMFWGRGMFQGRKQRIAVVINKLWTLTAFVTVDMNNCSPILRQQERDFIGMLTPLGSVEMGRPVLWTRGAVCVGSELKETGRRLLTTHMRAIARTPASTSCYLVTCWEVGLVKVAVVAERRRKRLLSPFWNLNARLYGWGGTW